MSQIEQATHRMLCRRLIQEDQWQASFFDPIADNAGKFLEGTRELRAKIGELMRSDDPILQAIGIMARTRYHQITKPIVEKFTDE